MDDGFIGLVNLYRCNARVQIEYYTSRIVRITLISYSTRICYVDCFYKGGIDKEWVTMPIVLRYPPSHTTWLHVWKFLRLFYSGERLKQARGKFDE